MMFDGNVFYIKVVCVVEMKNFVFGVFLIRGCMEYFLDGGCGVVFFGSYVLFLVGCFCFFCCVYCCYVCVCYFVVVGDEVGVY
ncbi:hypothetical protein EHS14_00205 [Schaalia georgiae]|nr:hypothetical protein EHS14_00205 [Schaalia georgiae]